MRRYLPVLALLVVWVASAPAAGLLIPEEKTLPPLAMLNHKVTISIEDQVAVTTVEQTFRNHTDRQLEATYVFPVPKGASVNKFTMQIDGKDVKGELVEAAKAREIYQSIVRRTQDPGLLEYMGNNLFRMRVFPIPPKGDQKVTLSYTSVANREGELVEYIYPLKADGKAISTLDNFSISATVKSQHAVQNVYSPTHAIMLKRTSDKEVTVNFDRSQGLLDKDFQLYYSLGDKDIGLTALAHRPIASENGYFMMLITPKVEIAKEYQVPRDIVLVLDTSGSMRGAKMDQARKALKYFVKNLTAKDRFAVINFATTVNKYRDGLVDVNTDQIDQACKWIDNLEATGGTAINDAMAAALDMRPKTDEGRTFTVVFFTDGQPTIGETNPDKILKNTLNRNSGNTRLFTFGVGHDVNAQMLDQLAEQTRAVSTYVRPEEDIEAKVSGLHGKISHPVLANLKLAATNDVSFLEVYPAQMPDLFHGTQLVGLGRYNGKGPSAIRLTGTIGKEPKEFVYELTFPEKTRDDKAFVEEIWARRKVGYLLDQIRVNGDKKELVEEVTALAKKYGVTTPYTSWLIVPDGVTPVARAGEGGASGRGPVPPPDALAPANPGGVPGKVADFVKGAGGKDGDKKDDRFGAERERLEEQKLSKVPASSEAKPEEKSLADAKEKKEAFDEVRRALARGDRAGIQAGRLGVDLAVQMNNLRNQSRLANKALKNVGGRNCIEVGGIWVDESFDSKKPTVTVKAMSDAYFRILEKQPQVKDVFQLGNYLVWVTPNGTNLIIDANDGKETLTDAEIDQLFVKK